MKDDNEKRKGRGRKRDEKGIASFLLKTINGDHSKYFLVRDLWEMVYQGIKSGEIVSNASSNLRSQVQGALKSLADGGEIRKEMHLSTGRYSSLKYKAKEIPVTIVEKLPHVLIDGMKKGRRLFAAVDSVSDEVIGLKFDRRAFIRIKKKGQDFTPHISQFDFVELTIDGEFPNGKIVCVSSEYVMNNLAMAF